MRSTFYSSILLLFIAFFSINIPSWANEWTDSDLSSTNEIRARHIIELRASVNNKRLECGMSSYPWNETAIIPKTTPVRGSHIAEIRTAVSQIAELEPARTAPSFDDDILAGETAIRYEHINQLRAAVESATCCGDGVCNSGVETDENCSVDCLCTYQSLPGVECGESMCDESSILITKTAPEEGCPTLLSCETKPSLCCSVTYAALGCGDGVHCGLTQRMTERIGLGCDIPEGERYICGADESCCEYVTQDFGCGATVGDHTYEYYEKVYLAHEPNNPNCADKLAVVENESECCSYIHKQSCGDPACGLYIYNKTSNNYEQCVATDQCPVVPSNINNIYFTCDYSETFPVQCAPNKTNVLDSPNCCTFVETFQCIDHVEIEGGTPVTRIGTDKKTTNKDPANADCTITETVEAFHNDCCTYNQVVEACVPVNDSELDPNGTKRVRLTKAENTYCPDQEEVITTQKTPDNPCCNYGDPMPKCGGQCDGEGEEYPSSTYYSCQPAANPNCVDIVTNVEADSDYCCQYTTTQGCGITCAGTDYGPNVFVKCKIPQVEGCPEVLAEPVQENTEACCNFVADEGCGLTCNSQSYGPGTRVVCQRSAVAGCPESLISETPTDEVCCAYTTQSDCGITCAAQTNPQSDYVECKKSSIAGCPETLLNKQPNAEACCQYTTYSLAQLGCGKSCGAETNPPGTNLLYCQISQTGYCTNTHTRQAEDPLCCSYQGPLTSCADPNLCCGITCGATPHNPNERVWCRTSSVESCPAAVETQPHVVNHQDCCMMIETPASQLGCGKTCNGITYGPLDRVTKCYYSQSGRCNALNDIGVTTNDTASCCVYTLDPAKSGCGKTCNDVTYLPNQQIECRRTAQTGCQSEKATIIPSDTCCNYINVSGWKADLGWVTPVQAPYSYCRVTYRTSTVEGCSTPVFVSADCTEARRTEYCGFTAIYNACGPYTCGATSYQGKDFVTCRQASLHVADPYCATYATVDPTKISQCCAYVDQTGCGTDVPMSFCLGGPYSESTYLTCRQSNNATGCNSSGTVIGTPALLSAQCCNYTEETSCGLTCAGTPALQREQVYCKLDPAKPSCPVTRTATASDACCDYTATTGCGLTCNGTPNLPGNHVTCYTSTVPGCSKSPTIITADPQCCNSQNIEQCGLTCQGQTHDLSQWVSCKTSGVSGCPASTLNTLPIEDDPRCCSFTTPVTCGGSCGAQSFDQSHKITCKKSTVPGCPAAQLLEDIDDDPSCCNFNEIASCGGECQDTSYNSSQLITCKLSTVPGCPAEQLINGPTSNTQSCCQWGNWTTTPYGGCGSTLPAHLQARVFPENPISCNVMERLEIRYPTHEGCSIITRCIPNGCADCVYNVDDALNPKQPCPMGSGGACVGMRKCKPDNTWSGCEYTVCQPGDKIRCEYLPFNPADPYGKMDYKICNSCGDAWSECSCGQSQGLAPWDQVNCFSANPPCKTDPLHPKPCPEHPNNCPGIRMCPSATHNWESICQWKYTICTPGSPYGAQCAVFTPTGTQKAGKNICNECGNDVIKVSGTPKCFCIQDVQGCNTGIDGCDIEDGVYKCDPLTGQFSSCVANTKSNTICEDGSKAQCRCIPGSTGKCYVSINQSAMICTPCGRWKKVFGSFNTDCGFGTIVPD